VPFNISATIVAIVIMSFLVIIHLFLHVCAVLSVHRVDFLIVMYAYVWEVVYGLLRSHPAACVSVCQNS
jgi:hypothetical protein